MKCLKNRMNVFEWKGGSFFKKFCVFCLLLFRFCIILYFFELRKFEMNYSKNFGNKTTCFNEPSSIAMTIDMFWFIYILLAFTGLIGLRVISESPVKIYRKYNVCREMRNFIFTKEKVHYTPNAHQTEWRQVTATKPLFQTEIRIISFELVVATLTIRKTCELCWLSSWQHLAAQ